MLVGRYDGADGMKTGFVCASGFNMIGSATRDGKTLVAIVLGEKSAVGRTDTVAACSTTASLESGTQGSTLASLPAYGLRGAGPADMREDVCGKKKPATRSRRPRPTPEAGAKSPWLVKIPNPQARRGRRSAERPARSRWRCATRTEEYADVPIPTPRPDYPPVAKAAGAGRRGHQLGAVLDWRNFPSPFRC